MTRIMTFVTAFFAAAILLSGCNQAKDPAQVSQDVSKAEANAAEKTAQVERSAEDKVGTKVDDAAHTAAVQEQRLANTDAEGGRKIALAKCEALSGADQKSCREQADAAYEIAKTQAKVERLASDPK